ncbi:MAG: hypothetical protein JRH18_19805 [Deltaproteobacteria bacterium]|nr:hypothetical protein [Deltaproteobacteria bacterium]MBW1995334.1 hypothetical protein [Deltaproteobacteria bacterium]MBW2153899.1 hypothetical protein [Deltaproteobacteria bacterium]
MVENKKRTAAISAVMAYIRDEEQDHTVRRPPPVFDFRGQNLWAISGRQAQMQFRNLMQLRAFHALRG